MILLSALLLFLWGEPGRCLEEGGGFEFNGDIRHFAVANNTVYIVTEEELHHLNHDLTLVQSVTQRGIVTGGPDPTSEHFDRVSERHKGNATLRVNVLLPFVKDNNLISCGVVHNERGYCELLDPKDISNVLYKEDILVGPPWSSSASISFLVNVEKTPTQTETFILTAVQQYEDKYTRTRCSTGTDAVNLFNTNNKQEGGIFSKGGDSFKPSIKLDGNVEFVDGFQINSVIYLFSNLPSKNSNTVRLIWLEGKSGKSHTLKSLRGATLSISDGGADSRLLASSVIPGGPPVLWSGVFSVDGGQSNTELVLFDISPDLTGDTDVDPDFCIPGGRGIVGPIKRPKTLKQKKVLFRQTYMTSVLAVRQKTWMVFFIGTGDGQLIKLAVDKNYHITCPRVLYRAYNDRRVFPRIHLDEVDRQHVYVPFQNQMKRVPVSKCSTYKTLQECWSAQDPYCVWCSPKKRCTFEDDCPESDWLSIPDEFQPKLLSYTVEKDNTSRITLHIQIHLTVGQDVLYNFGCQFSVTSGRLCSRDSPPEQFPQCSCILRDNTLPTEGHVNLRIRLGESELLEPLKISNCSDISGSPTTVLCRQCIEAGCGWSKSSCSWANEGERNDSVCQILESGTNVSRPEITSISPNVVSFHGRNHAVLSGRNLGGVTSVRIQADLDCPPKESPVWNKTGASLTFHIPSTDKKGVVTVCAVLPDGSCHGNARITYRSAPSCTSIEPKTSWTSGKRKITLTGSYLEFVEGVIHSHALKEVRSPRNSNYQSLTYDTPAAGKTGSFTSGVSLRVANETLDCSSTITYHPDPEFTSFTATRMGNDVRITIQKKADKLDMRVAELSVWGIHEGKQYPCIMEAKETNNETDFFTCEIQRTNYEFQQLMMMYGDKTITLGPPSLLHQVILILRLLLIPCVIVVLVFICRWQKKLTAEMNKR